MAVLANFGWYQYTVAKSRADETTAALIWSRLDFEQTDDPKSKATVQALWDLADGTAAVRDAFLGQLTHDRYQIDILASASASIARAFGLRLRAEEIQRLLGPILDAIPNTTDSYQLQALAEAVHTLGPTPEQAQAALGPVLDAIPNTTDSDQLAALAQAVQGLGAKLTPEQAQAAFDPILDAILNTTKSYELQVLAQAVQTLGAKLMPEQAQAALGPVLDAIPNATDSYQLQALAQAVQILGPTPEQAQAALGPVLDAIPNTTNRYKLAALAQAVQTLGPKLEGTPMEVAIEVARTVLATTDEPNVAEAFARAIAVSLPAEPEPYVAVMVELLKWPTTAGNATDALLDVLHDRVPNVPGKEAGLDATVAWVAATYPDIDLDSPPTFPVSGSTGGAW